MKLSLIVIFLSVVSLDLFAQDKYAGEYYNYFGSKLKLNSDSTFEQTWHFDLASNWTKGTWKVSNDTIYINIKPVYDTLKLVRNGENVADSLVLSLDDKAESISAEEYAVSLITGGGQSINSVPERLYYSRKRLIAVDENGKLKKRKTKGILAKRKYVPWYIKRESK